MKIEFSSIVTDIDGQPMTDKDQPVTLKKICQNALLAAFDDERNLSADDKLKRFFLADKIGRKPIVDLKAEEIAEIKKCVGKAFPSPLIIGRAFAMLENKQDETTE